MCILFGQGSYVTEKRINGPFWPMNGRKTSSIATGAPPYMYSGPKQGSTYRSTADAVFQNMSLIEKERPEFVLIIAADHIYKMDYTNLLRRHADSGADLTVAAVEYPRRMARAFGVLQVNSRNEVIAFE